MAASIATPLKKMSSKMSSTVSRLSERARSPSRHNRASSDSADVSEGARSSSDSSAASDLSVPATQKVCIVRKIGGKAEVDSNYPVRQPSELKPGECLVRMTHSGVCHSDLHAKNGDWPVPPMEPLVGGHEGSGVIIAIGEGTQESPVKVGDRVGVKWIADACLQCEICRKAVEQNCPHAKMSGYTVDGTFSQYLVSWVRQVTPIPDGVDSASAAPILCAGVTVYAALRRPTNLAPGDWIAIVGAGGGLGHLAIQYAHAMGYNVIAIDSGEEKRKLAVDTLKAEAWVDFQTSKNIVEDVKNATPGALGVHAALVVATSEVSYEPTIEYIRPAGNLIFVGLPKESLPISIFWTVFKNITIHGSYVGNRQQSIEALQMAAAGKIKTFHELRPMSDLQKIYEGLHSGKIHGRVVLEM